MRIMTLIFLNYRIESSANEQYDPIQEEKGFGRTFHPGHCSVLSCSLYGNFLDV